ncbi:MAG: hypothetical protein ACYC8S_01585 [Minisyncoccota bacterium]
MVIRNGIFQATTSSALINQQVKTMSAIDPSRPGAVVASKTGTKYHLPGCAGAQKISETNKVWFASRADAEIAGYTPAANCKGL